MATAVTQASEILGYTASGKVVRTAHPDLIAAFNAHRACTDTSLPEWRVHRDAFANAQSEHLHHYTTQWYAENWTEEDHLDSARILREHAKKDRVGGKFYRELAEGNEAEARRRREEIKARGRHIPLTPTAEELAAWKAAPAWTLSPEQYHATLTGTTYKDFVGRTTRWSDSLPDMQQTFQSHGWSVVRRAVLAGEAVPQENLDIHGEAANVDAMEVHLTRRNPFTSGPERDAFAYVTKRVKGPTTYAVLYGLVKEAVGGDHKKVCGIALKLMTEAEVSRAMRSKHFKKYVKDRP